MHKAARLNPAAMQGMDEAGRPDPKLVRQLTRTGMGEQRAGRLAGTYPWLRHFLEMERAPRYSEMRKTVRLTDVKNISHDGGLDKVVLFAAIVKGEEMHRRENFSDSGVEVWLKDAAYSRVCLYFGNWTKWERREGRMYLSSHEAGLFEPPELRHARYSVAVGGEKPKIIGTRTPCIVVDRSSDMTGARLGKVVVADGNEERWEASLVVRETFAAGNFRKERFELNFRF
jgi:hypothetical protein